MHSRPLWGFDLTRWLTYQDELLRAALTTEDLAAYRQGFQTMAGMTATVFSMDVQSLGSDVKLPFLLLQGTEDHITPTAMAERYLAQVTAPLKRIVLLYGAGHFALMTHMAQFAVALTQNLRPLLQ
jgi:pimeloyl-ACP methyl ester carboxylesterase